MSGTESTSLNQQLNIKADGGIAKLGISLHGPRYRPGTDVCISRSSFFSGLSLSRIVLNALHSEGPVSFVWNSQSLIDW